MSETAVGLIEEEERKLGEFLTEPETAAWLGLAPQTLRLWRSTGRVALPFVRFGRAVRYRRADVERFIAQNQAHQAAG